MSIYKAGDIVRFKSGSYIFTVLAQEKLDKYTLETLFELNSQGKRKIIPREVFYNVRLNSRKAILLDKLEREASHPLTKVFL